MPVTSSRQFKKKKKTTEQERKDYYHWKLCEFNQMVMKNNIIDVAKYSRILYECKYIIFITIFAFTGPMLLVLVNCFNTICQYKDKIIHKIISNKYYIIQTIPQKTDKIHFKKIHKLFVNLIRSESEFFFLVE